MDKIGCDVIRDLLPLYIDGECSAKTVELVSAHIHECEQCRGVCEEMKKPVISKVDSDKARSEGAGFVKLGRKIAGLMIVILVMGMGIGLNFSAMYKGDRAIAPHTAVSLFYVFFWFAYTHITRNYKKLQKLSLAAGIITLMASIAGIILPHYVNSGYTGLNTSLLAAFFLTPLYGLGIFGSLYYVTFLISIFWVCLTAYNILRPGDLNLFNQISVKEANTALIRNKSLITGFLAALIYAGIYAVSRLFLSHLYTPEWTSRNFLLIAAIISILPVLWKAYYFPFIALGGYTVGVICGELFGKTERIMDKGLPPMPVHNGWFITIETFLIFCIIGIIIEIALRKKRIRDKTAL